MGFSAANELFKSVNDANRIPLKPFKKEVNIEATLECFTIQCRQNDLQSLVQFFFTAGPFVLHLKA